MGQLSSFRGKKKTLTEVQRISNQPNSIKELFRVLQKQDLETIGASPEVQLALSPISGIHFSASTKGEVLSSVSGGTHGHLPNFADIETDFIGWGTGIKKGATVPQMGLEDITPLIIELLSLKMIVPDGALLQGIWD